MAKLSAVLPRFRLKKSEVGDSLLQPGEMPRLSNVALARSEGLLTLPAPDVQPQENPVVGSLATEVWPRSEVERERADPPRERLDKRIRDSGDEGTAQAPKKKKKKKALIETSSRVAEGSVSDFPEADDGEKGHSFEFRFDGGILLKRDRAACADLLRHFTVAVDPVIDVDSLESPDLYKAYARQTANVSGTLFFFFFFFYEDCVCMQSVAQTNRLVCYYDDRVKELERDFARHKEEAAEEVKAAEVRGRAEAEEKLKAAEEKNKLLVAGMRKLRDVNETLVLDQARVVADRQALQVQLKEVGQALSVCEADAAEKGLLLEQARSELEKYKVVVEKAKKYVAGRDEPLKQLMVVNQVKARVDFLEDLQEDYDIECLKGLSEQYNQALAEEEAKYVALDPPTLCEEDLVV